MSLDAEHWEELQALFHRAEQIPDAELDGFLLEASTDAELRARAAALIRAARTEPEDDDAPEPASESAESALASRKIGPYTVLRHLGSGGVGSVYLVERTTAGVSQRAALKALTRSAAGPFFTERFAREQHILATLDHPNITRLLDAGFSDEGEPYLIMEYVDGVHLDVYCDDHVLGVPERLEIFLRVCEAVAYAHRNLVVHLDLKPSNILVTEAEGNVKLLDFGTSKLIQPDSLLTTTVMATPAYASPEQLMNEPVTTVCDIYALGAILFELLSGRRPNQDSSVALMIERSMKELPPEPVTAAITAAAAEHRGLTETRLRSVLQGDLATIVAKCISPRPKDRYATVEALIADVQRHLAGRPILARPQTTTYRLSKFVRRNRKAVAAGVFAAACLIAMAGYAAWRQEQALREGRRALEMQTFMSELFKLANTSYMGKPSATIPEFLQLGIKVVPDLIRDPADRRAAQLSLAESMFQDSDYTHAQPVFAEVIADAKSRGDLAMEAEAEGYAGRTAYNLGETDQGKVLAAHALSLAHARGVTPSARIMIEVFYASSQEDEGFRTDENVDLLRAAVKEANSAQVPENELALATLTLGEMLGPRGQLDEEDKLIRKALSLYQHEPYAICDQANADEHLALVHNQVKDFQGSLQLMQQAYAGYKVCDGEDSQTTLEAQGYLAAAMLRAGQAKAVIPMLEGSMPKWIKIVGPDSDSLATPLLFLTNAYLQDNDFEKAESTAANLVRVEKGRINPLSAQMGVCQSAWAKALAGERRYRDALDHAQLAEDAFNAENSKSPGTKNNAAKNHALLLDLRSKVR